MFAKLASFAAAAFLLASIAPPAHAQVQIGLKSNGVSLNGTKVNGAKINGTRVNGTRLNGQKANGRAFQGTSSFAIDAIELPAAMR